MAGLAGVQDPGPALIADAAGLAQRGGRTDAELGRVAAELLAADPDGARIGAAVRNALDMLLDGQHTGRYRWDQLCKTEKTHAGTLVEIGVQRRLALADGDLLDYSIADTDVDCKFSHRMGRWMIPPEAAGKLMLLIQASDADGTWSAGLLRVRPDYLREASNRDLKRALSERGRAAITWLFARSPLHENVLVKMAERDVTGIFAHHSGQQRVNELFRRAQHRRVSRTAVATVAMQDDYMKRVRDGGGARDQLRAEGIVIFGDYAGDQRLARVGFLLFTFPMNFYHLGPIGEGLAILRNTRLECLDHEGVPKNHGKLVSVVTDRNGLPGFVTLELGKGESTRHFEAVSVLSGDCNAGSHDAE